MKRISRFLVLSFCVLVAVACSDRSNELTGEGAWIIDLVESRSPDQFDVEPGDGEIWSRTLRLDSDQPLEIRVVEGCDVTVENAKRLDLKCEYGQVVSIFMTFPGVSPDNVAPYFTSFCDKWGLSGTDVAEWEALEQKFGPFGRPTLAARRAFLDDYVAVNFKVKTPYSGDRFVNWAPTLSIDFIPERHRERWVGNVKASRTMDAARLNTTNGLHKE